MKTLFLLCLTIFVSAPSNVIAQRTFLRAAGHIIARNVPVGLVSLGVNSSVELFIVEVKQATDRKSKPRFITVRYEDYGSAKPLPKNLFYSDKTWWNFSLRRDKSCDQMTSEGLFTPPTESMTLSDNGSYTLLSHGIVNLPKIGSILPCFIVRPGGIIRKSAFKESDKGRTRKLPRSFTVTKQRAWIDKGMGKPIASAIWARDQPCYRPQLFVKGLAYEARRSGRNRTKRQSMSSANYCDVRRILGLWVDLGHGRSVYRIHRKGK